MISAWSLFRGFQLNVFTSTQQISPLSLTQKKSGQPLLVAVQPAAFALS